MNRKIHACMLCMLCLLEIRYPKNLAKLKGAAVRITGNKPEGKNTMKERNIDKNQKKKKKKKIKSLTFVLINEKSKTRFSLGKPRHLKGNKGNWESIIRLKQFLTEFHFDLQSDQWSWPLQIKPFTWVQTRKEMERNNSPFPVICVPTETWQRVLQYFTKLAYNVQCTMYVISVLQINHVDSLSERTIDRFPCHATKN